MSNCKQNPECKQGQQNIREHGTFLFFHCSLYVFLTVPLLLNGIRCLIIVRLCNKKQHWASTREQRETMAGRRGGGPSLASPNPITAAIRPSAHQRPIFGHKTRGAKRHNSRGRTQIMDSEDATSCSGPS